MIHVERVDARKARRRQEQKLRRQRTEVTGLSRRTASDECYAESKLDGAIEFCFV